MSVGQHSKIMRHIKGSSKIILEKGTTEITSFAKEWGIKMAHLLDYDSIDSSGEKRVWMANNWGDIDEFLTKRTFEYRKGYFQRVISTNEMVKNNYLFKCKVWIFCLYRFF